MNYKHLFICLLPLSLRLSAMEQQLISSDTQCRKMAETIGINTWGSKHPVLEEQIFTDLSKFEKSTKGEASPTMRQNAITLLTEHPEDLNAEKKHFLRQYALHVVMTNSLQKQKSLERFKNTFVRCTLAAGGTGFLLGMYLCRSYMCTF